MIHVCDSIMGSGKSSAAIAYMNEHPSERFIYITPFLEEAKRVRESCPALRFFEPSNRIGQYQFSKVRHTAALIREGKNIASTHQAFKEYTPDMLDGIREMGYILIVDECVEAIEKTVIHPVDIEMLEDAGYVAFDGGAYRPTEKPYTGEKFADEFSAMRSRSLVMQNDDAEGTSLYYWMLSPELLTAFGEVFILTYMFHCQGLCRLLEMHGIPYDTVHVRRGADGAYGFDASDLYVPEYIGCLRDKIHILDNDKMNAVGEDPYDISLNWFTRKEDQVPRLKKNLENYFCHLCRDSPAQYRMWGTYKSAAPKLKGTGYTKAFVPFNARATNAYGDKSCLAYPINIFMDFGEKKFWQEHGVGTNEDLYALSTMVQWIWRSAIRNGRDVSLYLPSARMRRLLSGWMEDPLHPERAAPETETQKLKDGDAVRLNAYRIRERMGEDISPSFRAFLGQNRDTVFTAYVNGDSGYVSLREEPKWLLSGDDLIRADRKEGTE